MIEKNFPIQEFFTNLVIIKTEKHRKKEEEEKQSLDREFVERDSLREALDRMTLSEESIELHEIFNAKGNKRAPKKVLVFGRAGVGKTTLIDKITSDWTEEKGFEQFKVIYRLPIRNLNGVHRIESAQDSSDFISQAVACELYDDVRLVERVREHFRNHKEGILLLLDGLDEANPAILKQIDKLILEEGLHIVLTSRPGPYFQGHNKIDRRVENLGFSHKQVEEYVSKLFQNDEKKQAFLNALKEDSNFYSLAHIPLQLQMLCTIWGSKEGGRLPNTLTELYSAMIEDLWEWSLKHQGIDPNSFTITEKDKVFDALGIIADEGLKHGRLMITKQVVEDGLSKSKIESIVKLTNTGLMRPTHKSESFFFIHLTFQEYLIASRVSMQTTEEQRIFIRKNGFKPQYALVISFLAGLIHKKDDLEMGATKRFFGLLQSELHDLSGYYQMELILRSFSECNRPELNSWIETHPFIRRYLSSVCRFIIDDMTLRYVKLIDLTGYISNKVILDQIYTMISGGLKLISIWKADVFSITDSKFMIELISELKDLLSRRILRRTFFSAVECWKIRRNCVALFGRIRFRGDFQVKVIDSLILALSDSKKNVRIQAIKAINKIVKRKETKKNQLDQIFQKIERNTDFESIQAAFLLVQISKQEILPENAIHWLIGLAVIRDPEAELNLGINFLRALGSIYKIQGFREKELEHLLDYVNKYGIKKHRMSAIQALAHIPWQDGDEIKRVKKKLDKAISIGDKDIQRYANETKRVLDQGFESRFRGIEKTRIKKYLEMDNQSLSQICSNSIFYDDFLKSIRIINLREEMPDRIINSLLGILNDQNIVFAERAAFILAQFGEKGMLTDEELNALISTALNKHLISSLGGLQKNFPINRIRELFESLLKQNPLLNNQHNGQAVERILEECRSKKEVLFLALHYEIEKLVLDVVSKCFIEGVPLYLQLKDKKLYVNVVENNQVESFPISEENGEKFFQYAKFHSPFGDLFISDENFPDR